MSSISFLLQILALALDFAQVLVLKIKQALRQEQIIRYVDKSTFATL